MNKRLMLLTALILALVTMCVSVLPVQAQDETEPLVIKMRRDFGYGGIGNDIQGLFTISVQNESDFSLKKVVFMIDGEVLFEDSEAPFSYQFTTDNYPLGEHTLTAVGYSQDGEELKANSAVYDFVASSEGMGFAAKIVVPILILVVVISLISAIPTIRMRGKKAVYQPGEKQDYGMFGGAVCKHCGRPFARHIWGINLVAGKFDLCPYCGKWGLYRRATPFEIAQAEQAQLVEKEGVSPVKGEADQYKKDIDDSRYTDL